MRKRRWATRKPELWPRCPSGSISCARRSRDVSRRTLPRRLLPLRLLSHKKKTRKTMPLAIAKRTDAALLPIRGTRAGAAGRLHGLGADGDALRHPWPPDQDSQARRDDAIASRTRARRSRAHARTRRPLLQLRRASGAHYVASSGAG